MKISHVIYEKFDGRLKCNQKYDGVKVLNNNYLTDTLSMESLLLKHKHQ